MYKQLNLTKPLIFFDLETTGTAVRFDRIVQIALTKITPDGQKISKKKLIHPTIDIPIESTEIHGITNEMVADAPTFKQISKSLYQNLTDCDLAGYNILRFDIPVLIQEFKRCGIEFDVKDTKCLDVYKIFQYQHPRNLEAAVKLYCNENFEEGHDAENDVLATIKVLEKQLEFDDIPNDIDEINNLVNPPDPSKIDWEGLFRWRNGEAIITIGKHNGHTIKSIAENYRDYFEWFLRSDFNKEAKQIVFEALRGNYPEYKPVENRKYII